MKDSVCFPSTATDNLAVFCEEYTAGDTLQKCQNNIQHVITVINKTKKKLIEYHCMLGRELMQYKLLSFTKNCEKCTVDKVAALSCRRCVKMSCNLTKLDEFMKFSCQQLNCSKDWVNFLISLGGLCNRYAKFRYVTLSLNEIKANMKILTKKINKDADFWNADV